MSAMDGLGGSEDVQEFLKRIRELSERKEREDAERTRKLEEDILEGRRQREARRLERARSLSPEKCSSSSTPRSYASPRLSARQPDLSASPSASPRLLPIDNGPSPFTEPSGTTRQTDEETLARLETRSPGLPAEPQKPTLPPKPAAVPNRAGTLSWQQRGGSLRGVRSRPLSLATDRAPSPLAKPTPAGKAESMSREDIARSLGSRDATFFRQTADRGISSAAYRKNQVEDTDVIDTASMNRTQLHGLSAPKREEAVAEPATPEARTSTPLGTRDGGRAETVRASWAAPPSAQESHRSTPGTNFDTVQPYSSATLGRSGSPTKGMGAFVQSAMMRRTDSVNKRWSAQASPDLSRANSIAGLRSAYGSPEAIKTEDVLKTPEKSIGSPEGGHQGDDALASPPSPSKRFSPVKSSWLESALAKPESPKAPVGSQQPSWLSDLNKNKMQRNSMDVGTALKTSGSVIEKINSTRQPAGPDTARKSQPILPEKKPKPVMASAPLTQSEEKPTPEGNGLESGSAPSPQKVATSINKPKPITPPKKDFRSTLKHREAADSGAEKPELEFLVGAGKLKRTVTGKYVPPDELKDNILRGKAGLQLTDGPVKTPRKDELKESLLKQKEAMQARSTDGSRSRSQSPVKRSTTPEAIRKRRVLASKASAPDLRAAKASEAAERAEELEKKAPALPTRKFASVRSTPNEPAASNTTTAQASRQEPEGAEEKPSLPVRNVVSPSSKLADRFNPNLAAILSRGSSPFVPPSEGPFSPPSAAAPRDTGSDALASGDNRPLEHMTKSRAKGPKRRTPKVEQSAPAQAAAQESRPPLPRKSSATVRTVSGQQPGVPSSSRKVSATTDNKDVLAKSRTWPLNQPANGQATKAVEPEMKSLPPSLPQKPGKPNGLRSASGNQGVLEPVVDNMNQVDSGSEVATSGLSVRGAAARWGRPMTVEKTERPASPQGPRYGSMRAPKTTSSSSLLSIPSSEGSAPHTPQAPAKPRSLSAAISTPVNGSHSNGTASSTPSQPSPIPRTSEAGRLFSDFFLNPSDGMTALDVDTQAILTANTSEPAKIKTLRKQIVELKPDGSTSPLPAQQDQVLFRGAMYLCTHVYGTLAGARTTEVSLWTGSSVSPAHITSATTHAQKAAKDISATFVHLQQGKEPSTFLQALGGILVTRSGTYSPSAGKSYLLRGRRHFGHLTFDEVPLHPSSLCPGYPCILVPAGAEPTTIFLWKGAGANPEEFAGAKLMAMDISPMADILEIDAGKESPDFFKHFAASTDRAHIPSYGQHWKLKGKHEGYRVRLFKVEHKKQEEAGLTTVGAFWRAAAGKVGSVNGSGNDGGKGQAGTVVSEIVPFCQDDLMADGVMVLDAYFEIYVILGPLAQHSFPAFTAALLFAQEYAILAASTEDRPSVPAGHVVVEGAPLDMKAVFRTWDDGATNTEQLMAGKAKGEKVIKMVPLTAAIAAVKGV